jgi:hypothetical protein
MASELSFVWGTPQRDLDNAELSRKIQKASADFAKDPSKGPGWSAYGSGEKDLANLGDKGDQKSITTIKRDARSLDVLCSGIDMSLKGLRGRNKNASNVE